ncbi:unnamed protein product [Ranitomeya imitator]|uniref:histone acetyltransferase n=1 Tax=Ranitomeya imitator TaxID=111125 RepID=A0ABN9L878_9NEOB|nr:unnamed protein product [Ranitomeya imitator]
MTGYQRRVLFLIYHAWNCSHRRTTEGIYNCDLPECRAMRAVLQHMESCEDGSTCQFSNCRYVSFTFTHYMICLRHDCEICWPVRSEINQLCGLEQLPATVPSYRWRHLTPAARACNSDRFFKVATFCFDDCFAHSWHSLDELQDVVTRNGFHFTGVPCQV